jgi:hypothetical protein
MNFEPPKGYIRKDDDTKENVTVIRAIPMSMVMTRTVEVEFEDGRREQIPTSKIYWTN